MLRIKIKYLLSFILCFSHSMKSFAQVMGGDLTKLASLRDPTAYKLPTGKLAPLNAPLILTEQNFSKPWIVYSDREDNITYKNKILRDPFSKLSFKKAFVVADQTEEAIRLVVLDSVNSPFDIKNGKAYFLPTAKDAGWISKKKMLLWSVCVVDTVNLYPRKVLRIKRLRDQSDFTELIKQGDLDFYNMPDNNDKNDKSLKLTKYLFIYKEENGMFLLGKSTPLSAKTVVSDLFGWVSKTELQEWNNA
ncbi:MAG: type VI secretion system protein TssR domain-containing protein, partial [Bacteroidota bacterium]